MLTLSHEAFFASILPTTLKRLAPDLSLDKHMLQDVSDCDLMALWAYSTMTRWGARSKCPVLIVRPWREPTSKTPAARAGIEKLRAGWQL